MYSFRSGPRPNRVLPGLILAFGFLVWAPAPAMATSAIVVTDLGGEGSTVPAQMQELGWEVTTAKYLELHGPRAADVANVDVIWVVAGSGNPLLGSLVREGGVLDRFTRGGGVIVVTDVRPGLLPTSAGPGGVRVMMPTQDGGGAVAITDAAHPMITGSEIGGVPLDDQDLDPEAAGANGSITMPPAVQEAASAVASDAEGPVVLDYPLETGRVILSTLASQGARCTSNLLHYVHSLRP